MSYLMGDDSHEAEHNRLALVSTVETVLPPAGARLNERRFVGGIEYYWDGTRWLSTQHIPVALPLDKAQQYTTPAVATTNFAFMRGLIPVMDVLPTTGGVQVDQVSIDIFDSTVSALHNYIYWSLSWIDNVGGSGVVTITGDTSTFLATVAGLWKHYKILSTPVQLGAGVRHLQIGLNIGDSAPAAHNIFITAAASVRIIGA